MADRKQLARKELARRELSRRKSIQQEPSLGQRSLGLGKGLVEQLPFQFNPFAQFRSAKRIASSATGQSGEKTSQVLREELLRPKSEAESLGRSFLSEAAFGAPRALLPENLEQEIIPDPTSDFGKFIKPAVDVGGFIFGPGKFTTGLGSKVLPKVAGEGAVKSIAKGALREGGAGAVAGGLSLQETPEGKISAEKQLKRATGFGLFGAGIGGGLGAAGALKAAIQKSKFDPSFITEQVAPKVQQLFKEQLEKFSPSVQEFARNQLKIPAQAVNTIKNRGIETVRKIRRKFNDSTDPIFQKINQGITSVDDAAKQAFKSTINRVPQGSSFPADKTLNSMQGVLKNLNLVDKNGVLTPSSQNVTDPAVRGIIKQFGILQGKIRNVALKQTGKINKQQIMDKFSLQEKTEIANRLNTTVSDLVLTSKFSKIQIIESLNPKEISKLIGSNRNISKGDFDLLKLEMDSLFQESKANRRLVQQVRESMFDDAEKIAPGVKRARDLFRKSKEAEKRFSQSQFKEKKLDNFQKISKDELRELRELEEFTGVKFVDDVDALTSARLLDKVDDFAVAKFGDESKLIQKLKKAESKSDFAKIKREFVELFGESKDLDKIFADIRQFGTVQNAKSLGKRGALIAAPIRGFR